MEETFARHCDEMGEGGAALAVTVGGELVVDLWAGRAGPKPWARDTRGVLFSASKGIAAIVVARLAEEGRVEVETPVASYWPEFAAAGKGDVTVAHVLSHSAGLPSIPAYQDFLGPRGEGWEDTAEILRRLQAAAPPCSSGTCSASRSLRRSCS